MSELTLFKDVLPELVLEQKKIISYLYKNIEDVDYYTEELFGDKLCCKLFKAFKNLKENNIPVNTENLFDYIDDIYITQENVMDILNIEYVLENISIIKTKLETLYSRKNVLENLESIGKQLLDNDYDSEKIKIFAENIIDNNYDSNQNKHLLTAKELMDVYKQKVADRETREYIKRSVGYSCINKLLTRPAGVGEMTIILGNKGSGKSLFLKANENLLINQGVCVLSINLEMSEESNCDRLMSIRTNLSVEKEIMDKELNRRDRDRFLKCIEAFSKHDNYIYYNHSEMNLAQLDSAIYEAKKKFKALGVLPKDGYMVVTCDLLDMIEEVSNARNPYELKKAINAIHRIYMKHSIHLIGLVQSNENVIRGGKKFKEPEDCDEHYLQVEDIEGGSVYGARARVVLALNRPLVLKRRFFPTRQEEWDLEDDLLNMVVVKQNDGKVGCMCQFAFDLVSFRLHEYKKHSNNGE